MGVLDAYIDQIEDAVDDPVRLRHLRIEVSDDQGLGDRDRAHLVGRIDRYLGDRRRMDEAEHIIGAGEDLVDGTHETPDFTPG